MLKIPQPVNKFLYLGNDSLKLQMRDCKKEMTFLQDELLVPALCPPSLGMSGSSFVRTGLVFCFHVIHESCVPISVHGIISALHSPTIPASPSLLDLELGSEWQQLQSFKLCLR